MCVRILSAVHWLAAEGSGQGVAAGFFFLLHAPHKSTQRVNTSSAASMYRHAPTFTSVRHTFPIDLCRRLLIGSHPQVPCVRAAPASRFSSVTSSPLISCHPPPLPPMEARSLSFIHFCSTPPLSFTIPPLLPSSPLLSCLVFPSSSSPSLIPPLRTSLLRFFFPPFLYPLSPFPSSLSRPSLSSSFSLSIPKWRRSGAPLE